MTAPAATDAPRLPGAGALALRADGIAKAFGATRALRAASLELRAGELHAIVGENGSGKSTLVKVLAGVHRPDAGALELDGRPLGSLTSPRAALAAGIATVFQEVLVVEPRSVLENVWAGADGVIRTRVPAGERRARAQAALAALLERPPSLRLPAEALSLSDRQACCIARALVREPRVLILDEATSALDIATRDRLFATLRRLAAAGTAVVFISHRMDEIAELADRCTVMRSGETVATLAREEATPEELVRLMTGAEHLAQDAVRAAVAEHQPGPVVLRAAGLRLRPDAPPLDVAVRAGELVGLAGLEGHGQDDFLRALRDLGGEQVAYVPRERRAESLFPARSIRENFGVATLARDRRRGLLRPAATRARLAAWTERLQIRLGDPDDPIATLSGGNQQKVVIARWLATEPRVLLLNDPTRGIDLGAKRDLYRLLVELTAAGVAVVMLSTELDEHVELMDRVLVFREHALVAELSRAQLGRHALVTAFFREETHA